ncbi:hypothetical protein [Corynebacterium pseudodiphtheriticum]|nr:hypothetical protein [Corynebacterium pseudodiphtheriticum]MDC7087818.1 hypothetical protein [Corynebacterium pseudodiphtheriticum]
MFEIAQLLSADLFTPDGGITDPTSPTYAILWTLNQLLGAAS